MKSKLNRVEQLLCFTFWTYCSLFTIYKLYDSQETILQNHIISENVTDLQSGWPYLNRLKDMSDDELNNWKYLMKTGWIHLVIQFVISEIIRRTKLCHLKYWYTISSFIIVTLQFGLKQLFLLLIQPLLFASIVFSGGKKKSIWIASLSLIMFYNSMTYKSFAWYFLYRKSFSYDEVYILLLCIAWLQLRCISYCIDYIDRQEEEPDSPKFESFVDMLAYCFYAPMLFGPIILYEDFNKSYDAPNEKLWTRLKFFIWDMCHYLLYLVVLDYLLHYIYFYALRADMSVIQKLPEFALCGGALWMGVHFQTIYVITYGTSTAFAKLDNIETPPTPRCIARIHAYSQMWRYFDVGFYKFLIKYVYKPSMEMISTNLSVPETLNRILASVIAFSLIFMWHGATKRIFMWCLLNLIEVSLEHIAKAVSVTDFYRWFKKNILKTDAMETRFVAVLSVPLVIISSVSNMYILCSLNVGNLYFTYCFLTPPSMTLNTVLITVGLYCLCIVSMALKDVSSRTAIRKHIVKTV